MGVLQRFERRLGGLVEGAFAKVFKGGVEPVEIAAALSRECDERRAVSSNRTLVPNDFLVELATRDHERLAPYAQPLSDELAAMVREHAAEQRYTFVGPVGVRLQEDADLDVGVFRVHSRVVAAEAQPSGYRAPRSPGRERDARPRPANGPRLVVSGSGTAEREYELNGANGGVLVIGRGADTDIRLNDTGVSRRHGEVRSAPDGVRHVYSDLGSTNGSLVNGRSVDRMTLEDGDRIELGAMVLVYRRGGGGAPDERWRQ